MNDDELVEKIKQTLAKISTTVSIENVEIFHDEDADNNEILRIEVIFQGKPEDAAVFFSAVRYIRPELEKMGEKAFPLFSFTSQNDESGRTVALH